MIRDDSRGVDGDGSGATRRETSAESRGFTRRRVIVAAGVAGLAGVAGCTDGGESTTTDYSDRLAVSDQRVVLVEAKTLTASSALSQVRTALGQLFEYEHFDVRQRSVWEDREVVKCLLVTPPPAGPFAAYLTQLPERGIEVLWVAGESVAGPSEWVFDGP